MCGVYAVQVVLADPSAFSSVSSTVLPHCCAVWLAQLDAVVAVTYAAE